MFKDMHSQHSLVLAKGREMNTTNKSDTARVKCLKIMKQYAPMWELLLKYFRCMSSMKSNTTVVEQTALITIEGDGVKFEVAKETERTNSLAHSQAIHMIAEMDKELVRTTEGSRN